MISANNLPFERSFHEGLVLSMSRRPWKLSGICNRNYGNLPFGLMLPLLLFFASSCKAYTFKDVSIPKEVKTIRINYIDNKAQFIDPQLSPQLTEKLKLKINNQTRLVQVQTEEPDYDVQGWISTYNVTTAGVTNQQAATNRLTVSVHIIFKNRLQVGTKDFEDDVSRNFDFSANLTINEAQSQLAPTIVSNLSDEIFNRLFSNW
ncbi:MAG: LptE family protein [Chitinophagales bacterium]